AATRKQLGWQHGPFEIPDDIRAAWDAREAGAAAEKEWQGRWQAYQTAHPDKAAEFERRMNGELPENFDELVAGILEKMQGDDKKVATRKASGASLEEFAPYLPELIGGSADLTG